MTFLLTMVIMLILLIRTGENEDSKNLQNGDEKDLFILRKLKIYLLLISGAIAFISLGKEAINEEFKNSFLYFDWGWLNWGVIVYYTMILLIILCVKKLLLNFR